MIQKVTSALSKLILVVTVAFLGACNTPKYGLHEGGMNATYEIPDSLRDAYVEFIERQVSAATTRLTTCDYGHPEVLLREARSTALVLYGVR